MMARLPGRILEVLSQPPRGACKRHFWRAVAERERVKRRQDAAGLDRASDPRAGGQQHRLIVNRFYHPERIAGAEHVCRYVATKQRTSPNDGIVANRDAVQDHDLHRNPDIAPDPYRRRHCLTGFLLAAVARQGVRCSVGDIGISDRRPFTDLHALHTLNRCAVQTAMITERYLGIGIQCADAYWFDCIRNHQAVTPEAYTTRPRETKRSVYTQHRTCAEMFSLAKKYNAVPPSPQPGQDAWQQQVR